MSAAKFSAVLVAIIVSSGCNRAGDVTPPLAPNVQPTFDVQYSNFGELVLAVKNPTPDLLCFPTGYLSTAMSSVQFDRIPNGKPVAAPVKYISEPLSKQPGPGPYYVAAPNKVSRFPVDTSSIVLQSGDYRYHATIGWFRCKDINTSIDFEPSSVVERHLEGSVKYLTPEDALRRSK